MTRSQRTGDSREPSTTGDETPAVEEQKFVCVCGRSFTSLKGRNIHRGKMKCTWQAENSLGSEPVSSSEVPGPVDNHSARDINSLLVENSELEPPAERNQRVKWPAANDKRWESFDSLVAERVKVEQEGKCFQERMVAHCRIVYEEGLEQFGSSEEGVRRKKGPCYPNRRQAKIDSLVADRRELRKKLRKARTDMEKDGYKALLKVLAESLMKLRRAEKRRKKQREQRKQRGQFKKNPFKTVKEILDPSPVGELVCTKEELDGHLEQTYGDPERSSPLGYLAGLPETAPDPDVPFNTKMISWKEFEAVVKKARCKSAPGNNSIPYVVYKRCPTIARNLWNLIRTAYRNGFYPDTCRFFEGVYIPKGDGNFSPSTGRPISLGNVQGKIYLAILARRLTEFVVENKYVDLSVQKGGVPEVKGCVEHFGAMWEVIKNARVKRKDLAVVWLDLANAYGSVPHVLIARALRFYNVPPKIVDIILLYFSGVYGRFSSKTVTSQWQKFEIGIFMGCVISVILFVLCMNLSDEFLKVKVPSAIEYIKDKTPIPPLKLFMDDSCLTAAKKEDMQVLLNVYKEFVDWSRFMLKSSKSRALVYSAGQVVEWMEEGRVEQGDMRLTLGEDVIPNVSEKPIKFLGRWIRADAKDKLVIEETWEDLKKFLERLDKSNLSGLQKCWGYQYLVLPKMKWPLAIYEIPFSTVARWEQKVNKYLRKWLGVGHTLSRVCMFSKESSVSLPIDSLQDTWKIEKSRLQQSYNTSKDKLIQAVKPTVASGRKWKAAEAIESAERDLECEAVRGMVQPYHRAGIGFGEWQKPWDRMSEREKQGAVMERVKKTIGQETAVQLGSLELQCRWATWRENVLAMDMSWHSLFTMGDSMVGFILSAVYGTLITPSLASKWNEDDDGMCRLCGIAPGTIRHILSGCSIALGQGRYTWRHNKVLRQIADQVKFHCDKRVNNPKRSIARKKNNINFTPAGESTKTSKINKCDDFGVLTEAKDWKVLSDLEHQLKFPAEIANTLLRPDLILYSKSLKRVVWWELTCPSEERITESHEYKLDKYSSLKVECECNGWSCYNVAVEVGARGLVAESLRKAASLIGIRRRALKKLVRDVGREAAHCSKWIYWLSGRQEWEYREVKGGA